MTTNGLVSLSARIPDLKMFNQQEKHVVGQLRFVIECKNLPDHGWIFFSAEPTIMFHETVSILDSLDPDPTRTSRIQRLAICLKAM